MNSRISPISVCFAFRSSRPDFNTLPAAAALAINVSRRRRIVALAAAHETGFPPKVLACAPAGQDQTSARAIETASGMPDAIPCDRGFTAHGHLRVFGRDVIPAAQYGARHSHLEAQPFVEVGSSIERVGTLQQPRRNTPATVGHDARLATWGDSSSPAGRAVTNRNISQPSGGCATWR